MDENPYQPPLAPLTRPQKAPRVRRDWTTLALWILVIYASLLIWLMWRTVL
jgi:hypothetical protein